jgi:hypothetical protein
LEDVAGPRLAVLIGNPNAREIDNLYRAVHYLQIRNLRLSIAAVMACLVYIGPTLVDYDKKVQDLGLTQ